MIEFCYTFISGYGSAKYYIEIGWDLPNLWQKFTGHVFMGRRVYVVQSLRINLRGAAGRFVVRIPLAGHHHDDNDDDDADVITQKLVITHPTH